MTYENSLKEMLRNDRFAAGAGVELLEVREGYAKARMLVTREHLNAGGVCQGGALFTLADLAFAAVANSRKNITLSLNAQITFLRAVSDGYIYAEATEVFSHAKVPFIEVSRLHLYCLLEHCLHRFPFSAFYQHQLPSRLHALPSAVGRDSSPASSGTRVTLPSSSTKHGMPAAPARFASAKAGEESRSFKNSFRFFTCRPISIIS